MKILLAVDGSEFSDRAVDAVASGAWEKGSAVKMITAVEPTYLPMAEGIAIEPRYYEEIQKVERERAGHNLEKAARRIRQSHAGETLTVETEVLTGSPRQVILDRAESWGADLIVTGSHGYGFWSRALLGSVSRAVASHAKCSVLIAR